MAEAQVPNINPGDKERDNMLAWLRREVQKGNFHALVATTMFHQMAEYMKMLIEKVEELEKERLIPDATNKN